MGRTEHTISIIADVKTQLSNMDETIKKFKSGLSEGIGKIDLTKGLGKDLSRLITSFNKDYDKITSLIKPGNLLNIEDSKAFQNAGRNIISTFEKIQTIANGMTSKSLIDAKKLFPDAFDSRVDEISGLLEKLDQNFDKIKSKELKAQKLESDITSLTNTIKNLKAQSSETNLEALNKELENAEGKANEAKTAIYNLINSFKTKINESFTKEAIQKIDTLINEIDQKTRQAEEYEKKGYKKKGGYGTYDGKGIKEWEKAAKDKKGTDASRSQAAQIVEDLRAYNSINQALREQKKLLEEINAYKASTIINDPNSNLQDPKTLAYLGSLLGSSEAVTAALNEQKQATEGVAAAEKALSAAKKAGAQVTEKEQKLQEQTQQLVQLKETIEQLKSASDLDEVAQKLTKLLGRPISVDMLKAPEVFKQLKTEVKEIDGTAFDALLVKLRELGLVFEESKEGPEKLRRGFLAAGESLDEFANKTKQFEQLKSRLSYFFGIANSINLLKRTIRSSINTVKELDAVMTETAVVTDFSVGDMWDKLPEYSSKATALGASIKDLYSATTLYYQQGLKTNEAMGVGVETMKMARIAGLEAGDATKYMTAALRGFNMEVNETNAQHVNDVYSELAAITAADTSQIATAMSKTASIAASANMEFETTSALLAQIIETTQEAPETAGTAMKTIIARFTEVKELFSEGQLTGEDEEGEAININKIDKALKTVGISLKDFLNGSKGIDDIFLELASKWDTLDLSTQRYIATMAAGSRQQSRFIAMMSNYERTMELVEAANDSAGASQEQFNKTLDSMEAKTQKMKNAWNEFTMGLANNDILKFGVDLLGGFLKVVNQTTDAISGGNGLVKSVLSLGAVIGGLKLGGAAVKKGLPKLFGIDTGGKVVRDKVNNPRVWDLISRRGTASSDTASQKRALKFDEIEHRQRMAWLQTEHYAESKAIEETKIAGIKAEAEKKKEGLAAIYEGKIASVEGEETEEGAALKSEWVEKQKSIESEEAEKIAAVKRETEEAFYSSKQGTKAALGKKYFGGATGASLAAGGIGGLIGGAIGGSIIAEQFDKRTKTAAEALDELADKADGLEGALETTRDALEGIETVKSNLKDYNKQLKTLEKGSTEYYKILSESNSAARELINSTLGQKALSLSGNRQDLYEYQNGQLVIDESFYQLYEQAAQQQILQLENQQLRLESERAYYQTRKNLDDSGIKTSNITDKEERATKGWAIGTGAATGAGAGILTAALAGISSGSLAGPVGAIVGLVAGLLVGAVSVAIGAEASQTGNKESDYFKLYKQLNKHGAEISQADVDRLQENGYDVSKIEDEQLRLALTTLQENIGPEAFASLIDSLDNNTAAVKENTGKWADNSQESFNARKQEFYNRLLALYPDVDPTKLEEQAGVLATQWSEDDLQREIDEAKNRQEYFGARGGKNSTQRDEWAAEVSSRASEAGMAVGNKGYVYHEGGQDYIWDATSNDYRELRKGEDAENAVLQKEAENQVLGEIVSGALTASFGQIGENIASEVEESYAYAAQQERIRQVEEGGTLESRYEKFISSEEGQAFSNSEFALLLENYVSTSGEEQITALEKIIYAIQTSPGNDEQPLVDAMGAMGIDILGLIDETWASGLYDTSMGFDREKVGTETGQTNLQDLTQVYTEDYLQELKNQLENILREQNEDLYNAFQIEGVDTHGLMNKIFSFGSSNLEGVFQKAFEGLDSELSEEEKAQLEESMNNLDLTNMSDLEEFFNLLARFGIIEFENVDEFTNQTARFTGAIEEAAKMTADEVNGLNSALDKLKNGEPLTPDDFQNLITQSPDIAGYFIETEDGYYLSTGSSAGEIEGVIQNGVREDLAEQGQDVEKSRQFNEILIAEGGENPDEMIERAQAIVAGEESGFVDYEATSFMLNTLKAMGVDTTGFLTEDVINNFKSYYENYGDYEAAKTTYQSAVIASGSLDGLSETEATTEVVDATLRTLAESLGIDANGLIAYKESLIELNGYSELMAGKIAEDTARINQATKTLRENWSSWSAAFDSDDVFESAEAYDNLSREVSKMLNVSTPMSRKALQNAKDLGILEDAIKGDTKAINELQEIYAKDLIDTDNLKKAKAAFGDAFNDTEELADTFTSTYEELANVIANTDLEPGAVAPDTLLTSLNSLYQQAYSAARAGGASLEQAMVEANEKLASVGFEPQEIDFTEVTVRGRTPTGWQAAKTETVRTKDPLGNFGQTSGAKTKKIPGETFEYTMLVPNLKSAIKTQEVGSFSSPPSGGGGGGSTKEWENPYDEYYNTTEQLNEHLREREKLERRYQRLLDQTNAKSENLVANLKEQLDSLKQEKDIREELLKNRERQMSDIETEYSDMRQYGYYDEKTQQIVIDWSKIEALDGSENEELTSRIEEYIGKLEEQQDLIEEEQDALEDINDAIWEIYQQGKDAYLSMENKIKEAIIADRQKEIDKLSDINDSINDTNSRLIDAMQSSVDKYRQDRENEKTEEELSDKQRRLAYLRQDTSGANALEIMQLQEELDEATEDYTDTLIDQKISELQEQNDKAAEQRQRQIELMQAQLDYYGESMLIWEEVNDLLVNGYDISKGLLQGSRLEELLRSAEGFEGMSQIEQMNWMKETNKELSEGFSWLKSGALQYLYGRGATIEFKDKDGNVVSGVINDDGDVEVKDAQGKVTGVYSGESFAIDANKNITSSETMTQASERVTKPQPVEPSTPEIVDASGNISSLPGSEYLTNDQVKKLQRGLNELLADGKLSGFAKLQVDGLYGGLTIMAVRKLQAAIGTLVDGKWGPNTKRAFDSSHLKAYKTGGLADFTGPAWLDGTKSRPEYILNAEQTKSFFQLVDVLSGLSNDSAQSSQITGDSIYDIDINVESVNNDYDVEQMAETIKRLINDDARYRNNNTINLQR